jgi:2-C-methyl-D-erythritol 4-phosphate cytidylyltransferase
MNAGVVLAGGKSERLIGFDVPKQFCEVAGVPIIAYALAAFEQCADIDKIVVVASETWRGEISVAAKFHAFAKPGETRQHSIYNGLLALRDTLGDDDFVVIHDAARPLATARDIGECVRAAHGCDGATPALPLNDTVYRSADGETITSLLNRDELLAGQTPECYVYGKYLAAHEGADLSGIRGGSELAFNAGMKIRLFGGNPRNIKITVAEDLNCLKYLLENGKA